MIGDRRPTVVLSRAVSPEQILAAIRGAEAMGMEWRASSEIVWGRHLSPQGKDCGAVADRRFWFSAWTAEGEPGD